ncbi:MAG: type II secretion system F family protein [Candidatus Micrarchaeaceae archaeon]
MRINYERLFSRNVVSFFKKELKLAGYSTPFEKIARLMVIGIVALTILVPVFLVLIKKLPYIYGALGAIISPAILVFAIYAVLELKIEQRKNFVEGILPDYLQLTAANIRSGIALDKALVAAARPEFGQFSSDVIEVSKFLYAGSTVQGMLNELVERYRSQQMKNTFRIITEAIQFGGGMTDLLNQISRDLRQQRTIQKEVSGQLYMYTIFIAFAALIGAPVLYALTSQMITVTDTVWAGILKENPNGLPTAGISFLKPSPPKITIQQYKEFAMGAIGLITGMASFIVSAIASGSVLRGVRFLPLFLLVGFGLYFAVSGFISAIFSGITGSLGATA